MRLSKLRNSVYELSRTEDYTADIEHGIMNEVERLEALLKAHQAENTDLESHNEELKKRCERLLTENNVLRERIQTLKQESQEKQTKLEKSQTIAETFKQRNKRLVKEMNSLRREALSESW